MLALLLSIDEHPESVRSENSIPKMHESFLVIYSPFHRSNLFGKHQSHTKTYTFFGITTPILTERVCYYLKIYLTIEL